MLDMAGTDATATARASAASPPDPAATADAERKWHEEVAAAQAAHPAAGLIAQATDPATGQVDTKALAASVAAAAGQDMGRANVAYGQIRDQLAVRAPAEAQRFDADVLDAASRYAADGFKGLGSGLSAAGRDLLVNNPILTKQWESTTSAWTGKGGFTSGLEDLLKAHGITVASTINASPAGSLGKTSGVTVTQANKTNGRLAEDAIANRLKGPGVTVDQQVPRDGGSRVVDVAVNKPNADPRYGERLEIESKVGRTSRSPAIAEQVAKDGEALARNGVIRDGAEGLQTAGKILKPVAIVADAVQLGVAFHADGDRIGDNTGRAASSIAGGWGGAIAGAEGGAALGTMVAPGVGTAVGGIAGGIVGALGGDWFGRRAYAWAKSLF